MGPLLTSNIVSIDAFLKSIQGMESLNPRLLPLRGRGIPPVWVTDIAIRKTNEKLYGKLRRTFAKHQIFRQSPFGGGLYFFCSLLDTLPQFYYIGIADSLPRRLQEHLRRLDFIFFSLAYPDQSTIYQKEVLEFYAEQKYPNHLEEYERQFKARIYPGIEFIGWLSSIDLSVSDWEEIETWFINEFHPSVNINKLDTPPNQQFEPLYKIIRSYLLQRCEAVGSKEI